MTLSNPIVLEWIDRIGWALLHSVWQAAAIAVLLALLLQFGHTWSSSARYAISCAALLLVVTAAVVTALAVNPSTMPQPNRATPGQSGAQLRAGPDLPRGPGAHVATPRSSHVLEHLSNTAIPWTVYTWATGVLALSLAQLTGWTWLRRCRHAAQPADNAWQARLRAIAGKLHVKRPVSLAITARIDVPIVVGVVRPIILAPLAMLNELPAHQVEAILAHELAHVRRHDYLVNLIQSAIETLLFYHPAVWWISKQVRRERECCCDEIAASACGDRAEYASALAAVEQRRGASMRLALGAAGSGRGELLLRVRRLIGDTTSGERSRSWPTFALLALVVALGWSIASNDHAVARQATTGPALIRPLDLVNVRITDLAGPGMETSKDVRVNESGEVALPLVGAVKIGGLTEAQAELAVQGAYRDKKLLENAQVSVTRVAMPAPATQPGLKAFRIVVGQQHLYLAGKAANWPDIVAKVKAMPADERRSTYVEVAAAYEALPVSRFFEVQALAHELVKEQGMAHVSVTGVDPMPEEGGVGEYYMGGRLQRVGVYSLTARKITLKQAIISAGMTDGAPEELTVTVMRRTPDGGEEAVLRDAPVSDLFDGKVKDVYLRPNDQVMVNDRKRPGTR